ncbi:MAG: DUF4238 domain-containing protein [Proteocatella sp.]
MIKKIRQHYVFQSYLSSWCVNNQLYSLTNNKIYQRGPRAVAFENNFYKIPKLNESEISFLNSYFEIIDNSNYMKMKRFIEETQNFMRLESFLDPLKEMMIKEINLESKISIDDLSLEFDRLRKEHDIISNNTFEDFLSNIERGFPIWLNKLTNKDLSFYNSKTLENSEEKNNFTFFLSMQYFRTKSIKKRIYSIIINEIEKSKNKYNTKINFLNNIDIYNILFYIIWYYQQIFNYSITEYNFRLTILINDTKIPFITSDQPVVNLNGDYENFEQEIKELILYYPIRPNLGLLLKENCPFDTINITEKDVIYYNDFIANSSYENIFANNKNTLEKYIINN